MATALYDNATYKSLKESFTNNGLHESISCIQGFILGLLAQGFSSGDRQILKYTIELLNDGDPLNGNAIASFTTLLIEMERDLKNRKVELYVLGPKDNVQKLPEAKFKEERLKSLSDLAYGISLGYGLTPQGALQDKNLTPGQRDDLILLEHIFQIDVKSDLDEDDLKEVVDYLKQIIYAAADKTHKKA